MSNARGIEEAIKSVISASGLRAMMLFSEWGTGKTHLVQSFFKTTTASSQLAEAKLTYVYVSLFGAESLQEIRRRLTVAALQSKGKSVLKQVSRFGGLLTSTSIAGIDFDLASLNDLTADYIQQAVVRNLFVCFDDLERAENLDVNIVLGFIAELSEQLGSKCLLVFNRSKMESRLAILERGQEKIFDLCIEYMPSVEENLSYGFSDTEDRRHAKRVFSGFSNSNIRIMRRTAWALQKLRDCGAKHAELWPEVVQHTAILTIIKHAHTDLVADLSKVISEKDPVLEAMGGDDERNFPSRIKNVLDELEYASASYDILIVNLLNTGVFVRADLEAAFSDAHEKLIKRRTYAELNQLWDELRNGFVADTTGFETRLKTLFAKTTDQITPAEMAQLADILLSLNPSEENKRIVTAKFAARLLNVSPERRIQAFDKFSKIISENILNRIPFEAKNDGPKLNDIILQIAGDENGWDPHLYRVLQQFTDEEIRNCLLEQSGHHATFYARRLLDRIPPHDQSMGELLRTRLKRIVNEIGQRNSLNRFQVEYFIKENVSTNPPPGGPTA